MICIPITAKTNATAIKDIKAAEKKADLIEIRLDYMKKLKKDDVKKLISATKKKIIATCRPEWEGGQYTGDEEERINTLKIALDSGAAFIDIELHTPKRLRDGFLAELKKNDRKKIIISYHNFKRTPVSIGKTFKKIAKLEPKIIKIVTMANTVKDNYMILKIQKKLPGKKVMFCMGEKGILSRILCTRFGSAWTFASDKSNKSASGQIDSELMKKYIKILR